MTRIETAKDGRAAPLTGGGRLVALALPYVAVGVGMGLARDAWLAYLLYHLGMVLVLWRSGWHRQVARLLSGWRRGLGTGTLVVAALAGPMLAAVWVFVDDATVARGLVAIGLTSTGALVWLTLYHTLVNPWLEELYWRGALASDRPIDVGDVAFAGYHLLVLQAFLPVGLLVVVLIVLTGIAAWWRYVTRSTGGLAIPALAHILGGGGPLWYVCWKLSG